MTMVAVSVNIDDVLGEPVGIGGRLVARRVEDSYRAMMAVISLAKKSSSLRCGEFSFYSPANASPDDPYFLWQYSSHFLQMFDRSPKYAVFDSGELAAVVSASSPSGPGWLFQNAAGKQAPDPAEEEMERIEGLVGKAFPQVPRCSEKELKRLVRSDDPADMMRLARSQADVHSYERGRYADRLDDIARSAPLDLRIAIAENNMAHPSTMIRMMTEDPDWRVRRAAFWTYGCYNANELELYMLASRDGSPEVRLVMPLMFAVRDSRIAKCFTDDPDDVVRCAMAFNYIGDDGLVFAAFADSGKNVRRYMLRKGALPEAVLKYMLDTSDDPEERASIMVAMLDDGSKESWIG